MEKWSAFVQEVSHLTLVGSFVIVLKCIRFIEPQIWSEAATFKCLFTIQITYALLEWSRELWYSYSVVRIHHPKIFFVDNTYKEIFLHLPFKTLVLSLQCLFRIVQLLFIYPEEPYFQLAPTMCCLQITLPHIFLLAGHVLKWGSRKRPKKC